VFLRSLAFVLRRADGCHGPSAPGSSLPMIVTGVPILDSREQIVDVRVRERDAARSNRDPRPPSPCNR